jgi:phosphate-selective porin OprO/OprP
LYENAWIDGTNGYGGYQASMLIRRNRIKASGGFFENKLEFKFELGISNRDTKSGAAPEFGQTSNMVLDAVAKYNVNNHFSIWFGQTKLPGNRERIISSGDLAVVDRSLLNSRFNLDRDIGFQFFHKWNINNFHIVETVAFSQGEGRGVVIGYNDGYAYTAKVEVFPFGKFKGAYKEADIEREETVKLAVAAAVDFNDNAIRERGQLGSFITDANGLYVGKDLFSQYFDYILKYKGWSIMGEFAHRETTDKISEVYDSEGVQIGRFYTGMAVNQQVGYVFKNNYGIAARYTYLQPDADVANIQNAYTLSFSKYLSGHKLKVQTDFSYMQVDNGSNSLLLRFQMDINI